MQLEMFTESDSVGKHVVDCKNAQGGEEKSMGDVQMGSLKDKESHQPFTDEK